jgi:diguanylate cyclase (GGDEF)-like protein
MKDSISADGLGSMILKALDMAVLRRIHPRQYRFNGLAPDFYSAIFPASADGAPCGNPWEFSPMLDYFLNEAEEIFAEGARDGVISSGFWLENDQEGREVPLSAAARRVDGIDIIIIHAAWDDYTARARILRQARNELLVRQKVTTDLDKYKKKALYDALTKVYSRGAFAEILNERLAARSASERRAPSSEMAMLMLDIDRFKAVNDDFGHLTGDAVLIQLGEILRFSLRAADTPVRYGGEEFVVLAPETDLQQAMALAEKLRQAVAEHDFGLGRQVTISLGCAVNRPGEPPDHFVGRADQALYEAKNTGRNRVCGRL